MSVRHFIQRWGKQLALRPLQTNILALLLALTPLVGLPLDWLSRVLLIFVTLTQGYKAGLITASWCLLPVIALAIAFNGMILAYVGSVIVLTWLCAAMLYYFRSVFPVIESLSLVGCLILWALHLFIPNITQWWAEVLNQYSLLLKQTLDLSAQQLTAFQSTLLPILAQYATGLQIALLILGILFNLWIAQTAYGWVYPNGLLKQQPTSQKKRWRVSHAMALLSLLVAALGGLAGWPLLRDMLPVVTVPLVLSGVYLIYATITSYQVAGVVLAGFFIACFYWPYLLGLILFAAWIDSWYDVLAPKTR